MRFINKPRFVKQYPRAVIIHKSGIWNVHIISHPIEKPGTDNHVGWSTWKHLGVLHDLAGRHAHTARAEQEQP